MLADRQAGLKSGDRLKFTANAGRRCGLHVKCVEVRRPAKLVQEYDMPRSGRIARPLFCPQERRQT
jgi:hypothetical protein